MKAELIVPVDEREVLEEVSDFFEEHPNLYHSTTLTSRQVEAKVRPQHAKGFLLRFLVWTGAIFLAPGTEQHYEPDPRIMVEGKPTGEGRTKLTVTTKHGVKPEAVEPLLMWLRENLAGVTV